MKRKPEWDLDYGRIECWERCVPTYEWRDRLTGMVHEGPDPNTMIAFVYGDVKRLEKRLELVEARP